MVRDWRPVRATARVAEMLGLAAGASRRADGRRRPRPAAGQTQAVLYASLLAIALAAAPYPSGRPPCSPGDPVMKISFVVPTYNNERTSRPA